MSFPASSSPIQFTVDIATMQVIDWSDDRPIGPLTRSSYFRRMWRGEGVCGEAQSNRISCYHIMLCKLLIADLWYAKLFLKGGGFARSYMISRHHYREYLRLGDKEIRRQLYLEDVASRVAVYEQACPRFDPIAKRWLLDVTLWVNPPSCRYSLYFVPTHVIPIGMSEDAGHYATMRLIEFMAPRYQQVLRINEQRLALAKAVLVDQITTRLKLGAKLELAPKTVRQRWRVWRDIGRYELGPGLHGPVEILRWLKADRLFYGLF
jgi:hypothetical protein